MTALVAKGKQPADVEWLSVEKKTLESQGVNLSRTEGQTVDIAVNAQHWDVVDLRMSSLAELVTAFLSETEPESISMWDLAVQLEIHVRAGMEVSSSMAEWLAANETNKSFRRARERWAAAEAAAQGSVATS